MCLSLTLQDPCDAEILCLRFACQATCINHAEICTAYVAISGACECDVTFAGDRSFDNEIFAQMGMEVRARGFLRVIFLRRHAFLIGVCFLKHRACPLAARRRVGQYYSQVKSLIAIKVK